MVEQHDIRDTISKNDGQIPEGEKAALCDRLIAVLGDFNKLVDIYHCHYFENGRMVDFRALAWEVETLINDIRCSSVPLAELARREQDREREKARRLAEMEEHN